MNPTWNSDSFYRAFGAELITKDGKTGVASQGGIKAITFFKENIELGITPKPEPGKSTQTLWLNGMSGMIFDGGWNIPTYKDTKFQWDMVKLPAGPSGQFSTGLGGTFVISKQTKYPKQAYEFLAYLTGTESLKELVTNTGAGVPGRRSAEEGLSPSMKKYAGLISTSVPYNAFNGSLELFDIQKKELEQVWYGVKKPEEALKTIETKGNEILQNKKK
jgi:multiple sugar transport system substrate-binding protein